MESNKIYIGENYSIMSSDHFREYYNKINFIYIDPPYNTSNNFFAYNDSNLKWVSDITKRLTVAKELLNDEGSIFISIDDNELNNLLRICYEIFGVNNYVGLFITKQAIRSNAKHMNVIHEYILVFAKNKKFLPKFYIKRLDDPIEGPLIKNIIKKVSLAYNESKSNAVKILKEQISKYVIDTGKTWIKNYSNIDDKGRIFFAKDLSTPSKPNELVIQEIGLHLKPLKTRGWSTKEKIIGLYKNNRLCFKNKRPYEIEYIDEATDNIYSILNFYSRQGTNDLKKMGLDGLFDTPKPVELIKFLIRASQHKDALILDFYAGSGTTAQAVYEINKVDKTNHKYILIQMDELVNKKSKAYSVMCELGYKEPKVSDVLVHRINTFLNLNNIKDNYVIKENKHG